MPASPNPASNQRMSAVNRTETIRPRKSCLENSQASSEMLTTAWATAISARDIFDFDTERNRVTGSGDGGQCCEWVGPEFGVGSIARREIEILGHRHPRGWNFFRTALSPLFSTWV